jgi:hypothetical protein
MERLKNWLNNLSNSSKFIGVIVLLGLGYLVYKHIDTKQDKLPYIGIITGFGLLWIYVTDCLSKGNCGLLSWIFAIMMSMSVISISGIFSEIPMKAFIEVYRESAICRQQAALNNPEFVEGIKRIIQKIKN